MRRTGWATRDPKYGWQFRKGLPTILEIDGEAVTKIHAVGIAGFAFIPMPENSQSPTNPAWGVRCSFADLGFKPFAEFRRVDRGNIVHDDWIDPNNPGGSYSLIYQSNTYTGGCSSNQGWQVLFAIYPIPVPSG